jgi:hypothetical protein
MAISITAQAKAATRRWYALRLDNPVLAHRHIMETAGSTSGPANEFQAWAGNEIAVRSNQMIRFWVNPGTHLPGLMSASTGFGHAPCIGQPLR